MKRSDIPSLDDLRAFEALGRLGSVRAAGDELALTHGAVSRRISKLSADVGVPLVQKDGRGVQLTPQGAELFRAATLAFKGLSETLANVRAPITSPLIVLSCERSIAMRWLIPRLSSFQDTHPDVDVHLSVGGGTLDFRREATTVALRRLDFALDPNWNVEIIASERTGPVMLPKLHDHFLSGNYTAIEARTRPDAWDDWLRLNPDCPLPTERRIMDHHFLAVEAAAGGLGVALSPALIAQDDVISGRLIAPRGFVADGSQYGILTLPDTHNVNLSVLLLWLREQMTEFEALS